MNGYALATTARGFLQAAVFVRKKGRAALENDGAIAPDAGRAAVYFRAPDC